METNRPSIEEIEKDRNKRLETLKASYLMYENSKVDTKQKHKTMKDKNGERIYSESASKDTIKLMETMQQDIYDEYIQLGGDPADLKKTTTKKGVDRSVLESIMKRETMKDELAEYVSKMNNEKADEPKDEPYEKTIDLPSRDIEDTSEIENYAEQSISIHEADKSPDGNKIEDKQQAKKQMYDRVKLPSKGIAYKSKKDSLKVAYLTAYDENMILSPGLYEDGSFLTKLLEAKILDEFNPINLLPGDRDAIVIWLRATGYGNEYPITVTDPESGKEFNTTFDLSTIKYKPFNLKADENGYFDFTLPVSGDVIKFKFLTIADHKFLSDLKAKETMMVGVSELRDAIDRINRIIKDNENIKQEVINKVQTLADTAYDEIVKDYDIDKDKTYARTLTNTLILQTISVNGIKDREYIRQYIMNMNVKDAAEYRKYVSKNEPGIEYNVKVERPKGLGGGSIDTFLQLSQFIFVNLE